MLLKNKLLSLSLSSGHGRMHPRPIEQQKRENRMIVYIRSDFAENGMLKMPLNARYSRCSPTKRGPAGSEPKSGKLTRISPTTNDLFRCPSLSLLLLLLLLCPPSPSLSSLSLSCPPLPADSPWPLVVPPLPLPLPLPLRRHERYHPPHHQGYYHHHHHASTLLTVSRWLVFRAVRHVAWPGHEPEGQPDSAP